MCRNVRLLMGQTGHMSVPQASSKGLRKPLILACSGLRSLAAASLDAIKRCQGVLPRSSWQKPFKNSWHAAASMQGAAQHGFRACLHPKLTLHSYAEDESGTVRNGDSMVDSLALRGHIEEKRHARLTTSFHLSERLKSFIHTVSTALELAAPGRKPISKTVGQELSRDFKRYPVQFFTGRHSFSIFATVVLFCFSFA